MSFSKGLFLHIASASRCDWSKNIQFIKKLSSVDHVEIWLENIYISNDDMQWIKRELSGYALIVHAPFMNMSLISNHAGIRNASIEILKKTIDKAILLGATLVTVHAGAHPFFLTKTKVNEILAESLSEVKKYACDNVQVALENLSVSKGIQISYPILLSDMSDLQKTIPSINYTLDVGHAVCGNDDFTSFLKDNAERIKNIHLHNATINGKTHFGFNSPGDIHLRNFLALLSEINYNGFIGLEIMGENDIMASWEELMEELA